MKTVSILMGNRFFRLLIIIQLDVLKKRVTISFHWHLYIQITITLSPFHNLKKNSRMRNSRDFVYVQLMSLKKRTTR